MHCRVAVDYFRSRPVRDGLIEQVSEHKPPDQCLFVAAIEAAKASKRSVRRIKVIVGQIHKAPVVAPPVPSMALVPAASTEISAVVWTIKAPPVVTAVVLVSSP